MNCFPDNVPFSQVLIFRIAVWFIPVLLFLIVTLFYLCFESILVFMIQEDYAMESIRHTKRLALKMSKYLLYKHLSGKYWKIKIWEEGGNQYCSLENYSGILLEFVGGRCKAIKIK